MKEKNTDTKKFPNIVEAFETVAPGFLDKLSEIAKGGEKTVNYGGRIGATAGCDAASAAIIMGSSPAAEEAKKRFREEASIDWQSPVAVVADDGGGILPHPVRVLAHGIWADGPTTDGRHSTLVAVNYGGRDILVAVDPETGKGRALRTGFDFNFANVESLKTVTSFLNVYHNGNADNTNVVEVFDTEQQADDNNCFSSRDCLVALTVEKQPGGNWTASALVL